jgi:hypothetical protein
MLALYVLFGLGVFVLVAGAAAVYLFLQSEQGEQILLAAKRGVELVAVASSAPGTEELREAGCEVALVDTANSMIEVILPLLPDQTAQEEVRADLEAGAGRDLDNLVVVFCTVPRLVPDAPECNDLARVYGSAIEFPPDEFLIVVAQQGENSPQCGGLYSADGQLQRTLFPRDS